MAVESPATIPEQRPPRVFLSYSHDSDKHGELVLALSERLRVDGIETLLDQYVNGSPSSGWPRWMLDQVDAADYVLVVCTETYYRRFRGHEVPGKGKGVDWEGALITQELYDRRRRTLKFVPVFLSAPDENWIPEPLRGAQHYAVISDDAYQCLYNFLLGQAGVEPHLVGELKPKGRQKGTPLEFAKSLSAEMPPSTPMTSSEEADPQARIRECLLRLGIPSYGLRRSKLAETTAGWLKGPRLTGVELIGLRGIGKTMLAAQIMEEMTKRLPHIFAVQFRGRVALEPMFFLSEFNEFVRNRGYGFASDILERQAPLQTLKALARDFRRLEALLLLDGAEEAPLEWIQILADSLRGAPGAKLLLTTRRRLLGDELTRPLAVPALTETEAEELALDYAQQIELQEDVRPLLQKLPVGLRTHPQAIVSYLGHLLYFPSSIMSSEFSADPLVAPLQFVAESLEPLSESSRDILRVLSFLGGTDLAQAFKLLRLQHPPDFLPKLKSLLDLSLVVRSERGYKVPSLVREALLRFDPTAAKVAAEDIVKSWVKEIDSYLTNSDEFGALAAIGAQIGTAIVESEIWDPLRLMTAPIVLDRMNAAGRWAEYSLLLRAGIKAAQASGDLSGEIGLTFRLVRKLLNLRDQESARSCVAHMESLIRSSADPLTRAELHSHRAFLLQMQGSSNEALEDLLASRALRLEIEDHAGLAVVEKLLGNHRLAAQQWQEAREHFDRALSWLDRAPNEKEWFEIQTSLALCDLRQERAEAADQRLGEVFDHEIEGRYPAGCARAFMNRALALESLCRPVEAADNARQAIAWARRANMPLLGMATLIATRLQTHVTGNPPAITK